MAGLGGVGCAWLGWAGLSWAGVGWAGWLGCAWVGCAVLAWLGWDVLGWAGPSLTGLARRLCWAELCCLVLGWLVSGGLAGLAGWIGWVGCAVLFLLCCAGLGHPHPPTVCMPAGEGLCALHGPVGVRWRKPGSPLERKLPSKGELSGRLCWAGLGCAGLCWLRWVCWLALGCAVLAGLEK